VPLAGTCPRTTRAPLVPNGWNAPVRTSMERSRLRLNRLATAYDRLLQKLTSVPCRASTLFGCAVRNVWPRSRMSRAGTSCTSGQSSSHANGYASDRSTTPELLAVPRPK
jgi:hypothetical protein